MLPDGAFGRRPAWLAMPRIATPCAPGRKPWEAVSMGHYQRSLVLGQVFLAITQPYTGNRDGRPLWITGLARPDSRRSLRQASYPQLLHHAAGHDHPNSIVGAAYTLRIGPEIYVTPHMGQGDRSSVTKRRPAEKECFTIPAGQFGFLLTEVSLTVPYNLLGFISIRATIKFKGLVNVSGFHVDPGFKGRLIFSVFNAGPAPVHLKRGDGIFLLGFHR